MIEPIKNPFTIITDTREQSPFQFLNFIADSVHRVRISRNPDVYEVPQLYIPTEVRGLKTGDYSIDGLESEIAIERKSLPDLYGTIGSGRERFVRELERLSAMKVADVVIECDFRNAMMHPPVRSRLPPKAVFRSIISWSQQFRGIHWHWASDKWGAEVMTFRILERFWKKSQEDSGKKTADR